MTKQTTEGFHAYKKKDGDGKIIVYPSAHHAHMQNSPLYKKQLQRLHYLGPSDANGKLLKDAPAGGTEGPGNPPVNPNGNGSEGNGTSKEPVNPEGNGGTGNPPAFNPDPQDEQKKAREFYRKNLAEQKKEELQALAGQREFPKEEWENLKKEELLDYLTEKLFPIE